METAAAATMGGSGEQSDIVASIHGDTLAIDQNSTQDTDGNGGIVLQQRDTVAHTTHKAQARTSMQNSAQTLCRVHASVGLSGQASVSARDGCPTPPRSLSPEPEPEAEPPPQPAPPPPQPLASFSDEEALGRLVGPPISDTLLQGLLNMSAEERMRLAEELLRSLDPDDLRALLQQMRRFPWEVDCEAQTDHSGEIGTQDAGGRAAEGEALEQASSALEQASSQTQQGENPETKAARPKTLFVPEKRALNQFLKGQKDKKAKPQGLKVTRRTIAKVYEDKAMADEADDLDVRARDGFPTFLYDYMLKEFGIKSLAMQNLAKLVKSVVEYANPESQHYDERVHVFGKLSGSYYTVADL